MLTVVLPGLNQSPGSPPTKTEPPERKQRKRGLVIATVIGLVVALAASTFAVVAVINRDDASAEVYLEASNRPGANPFTKPVANQNPTLTNGYNAKGKTGTGVVLTVAGTEPGLYGGTQNNQSCDPDKLVKFLTSEPAKAAAWAGVLAITPAQIPRYVAGLTSAILRADTRVTNHGFANGTATILQSVLQAGTAVLVDNHGIPRVRCSCGNPLTEPEPVPATYTGAPWPNFDEHHVVAITNGPPTDTFTLTDPTTGTTYTQPTGTSTDTGVFALGTNNGLQLLKDGNITSTALPGQRVFDLAESPDHTRLAFFSQSTASGFEHQDPTTLSILEHDGTIATINSNLSGGTSSLTWVDSTHLSFGEYDADTGDPSSVSIIQATANAQPDPLTNLASYGGFSSAPGVGIGLGEAYYSETGPHWIDFKNRTETAIAGLDYAACGNGPPHSCHTIEFSPNGTKVLAVTGQGVLIADPGGIFTSAIAGADLLAFWLDDHRIAYTTRDSSDLLAESQIHVLTLGSQATVDRGPGTAIGSIGNQILVANRRNGIPASLQLLDLESGIRRSVSGEVNAGEIPASFNRSAMVLTYDDNDPGMNTAFSLSTRTGVTTLVAPTERTGPVNDVARSPAASLRG